MTVALSGDGGDEIFGGYERYRAIALARAAGHIPALAEAAARALRAVPGEPTSRAHRLPRRPLPRGGEPATGGALRTADGGRARPPSRALRARLRSPSSAPRRAPDTSSASRTPRESPACSCSTYGRTYPTTCSKADLASMAHSLELRSPLLDVDLAELALGLPDHLKATARQGKVALRRAFADVLPPEILRRGKKGFGVPVSRWFRESLRELAGDLLLDDTARARGLFRPATLERLLADHVAGRVDHGSRLWAPVMLELWHRSHVDRVAGGGVPVAGHAA